VEDGKIGEIESLVARTEKGALSLEKLGGPHPVFLQTAPPVSRVELVKTANMHFSGLERDDGKGVYPFTDDCNRIENGGQTTNSPSQKPGEIDISALGCKAQFETGFFNFVTRIRDRRFVVVDRERALVLAFVFFDHAGNIPSVKLTDGRTAPIGVNRPFTWEIAELFKVENGKLRQIEAVLEQCPYGMGSGWSGWEDALSSGAR
jgi:hypothetical protein